MTGKLYLVDALVDRLEDITMRAERVLADARLIVTQDPERARELCQRYGLHTPLLAFQESRPRAGLEEILDALGDGDVAWVSAGAMAWTGTIHLLFRALCEQSVELVPIPGPGSTLTALVMSGLPAVRFTFLGVLPSSPAKRRDLLEAVSRTSHTLVCEISNDQLPSTLTDIRALLGDRRIAICQGSDIWRGRSNKVPVIFRKGACTLVIQGAHQEPIWPESKVREQILALLATGHSPSAVARSVALRSGWPKRKVYQIVIDTDPPP